MTTGAYGRRLGDVFRLGRPPAFVTRALCKSRIAVTHIRCKLANNGLTGPIPREDAFLVTLQLRDCPRHDLWLDGRPVRAGYLKAGTVSIYDLRLNPVANSISPFESLHFYLPHSALDTIADMEGSGRVDAFNNDPGLGIEDLVIHGLGCSLLPSLARPAEANRLFVDHVTLATAAYVLRNYGVARQPPQPRLADLAPWQERRVKDILSSRLDGDVSVTELARECGMSAGDFSRAFRHSTGMLPHGWLLRHRIDRAMTLLRQRPQLSLDEVASACGFASESHFVRAFVRHARAHPRDRRDV